MPPATSSRLATLRTFVLADLCTVSPTASPWRNRSALLALTPIALLFLVVIAVAPWHSNYDIDSFTHYAQLAATARHGLPWFDNGPATGNAELTPNWLFPLDGHVWGTYPPIGSYLLAPGFIVDGFRGAIRTLWLSYALAALGVYAVTYRSTRRPALAVASAYALAIASPLWMWGTMIVPFILVAAAIAWSLYLGARAFDDDVAPRRALLLAAGSGLLGAVAVGCHYTATLCFGLVGLVFALHGQGLRRVTGSLAYGVGAAPVLGFMALINHLRFGTWNPVSYGPCGLGGCLAGDSTATNPQNGGAFLEAVRPALPYLALVAVAFWLVRRSRGGSVQLVALALCAALLPDTPLRDTLHQFARVAWGHVVDYSVFSTDHPRSPPPVANMLPFAHLGRWMLRSLLQGAPLLAAALAARAPRSETARPSFESAAFWMCAACCVGNVGVIVTRSLLPSAINHFGFNYTHHRYLVPMIPGATVLAFTALARTRVRAWHVLIAAAVAVGLGSWFARSTDDDAAMRGVSIVVPLALAFGVWIAATVAIDPAGRWPGTIAAHAAPVLAAACFGYGVAITYGVDVVSIGRARGIQDGRTRELARCTPARFILMGGHVLDQTSALSDQRDIILLNVGMGPRDGSNARRLLDRLMTPDRPAFFFRDTIDFPWTFNWPGYDFQQVPGCPRVWRFVRTSPVPAAP